ncbi:hypothetical protein KGM_204298 [Danaus plexippus plexippus]|uniref:Uncharacterized protein n=1 Tax=Danaus plexippus plexippus TaxID=278856 RepID=A0A212F0A1_DANPL|nr:hypothetical protein KGM_204298 [Danaus plexippus plexippus]
MLHRIFVFACIIAVTKSAVFETFLNILPKNDVNLGAYGGRVDIGQVPNITELTDVDKKASIDALRVVESMRSLLPTGIMTFLFTNKDFRLITFNIKGISVVGAVGTAEVDHEGKKVYQVQTMQGKFHADAVHLYLGVGSKLIQDILNFLNKSKILDNSPEVKFIKRRVNDYFARILKTKVNEALERLTLAQIKAYILG